MNFDYLFYFLGWMAAGWLGGGHCLVMCGGFSVAIGAVDTGLGRVFRLVLMNAGRLISYMLVGAALGYLIGVADRVSVGIGLQRFLYAASLMLVAAMGAYIAGIASWFSRIEIIGRLIWPRIQPLWRRLLPINSPQKAILAGLLWGWLPCGLVYTAALAAMASGSLVRGSLTMFAFGLGTLPNLLAMGLAGSWLKGWRSSPPVRRVSGGLLIIYSLVSLIRLCI